jgi:hypothetical protein
MRIRAASRDGADMIGARDRIVHRRFAAPAALIVGAGDGIDRATATELLDRGIATITTVPDHDRQDEAAPQADAAIPHWMSVERHVDGAVVDRLARFLAEQRRSLDTVVVRVHAWQRVERRDGRRIWRLARHPVAQLFASAVAAATAAARHGATIAVLLVHVPADSSRWARAVWRRSLIRALARLRRPTVGLRPVGLLLDEGSWDDGIPSAIGAAAEGRRLAEAAGHADLR